jgi:hypothetical protein
MTSENQKGAQEYQALSSETFDSTAELGLHSTAEFVAASDRPNSIHRGLK